MSLTRRTVLRAACGGCAALGLAACGGSSSSKASTPGRAPGGAAPAGATSASGVIIKLASIPLGGSASAKSPKGDPLLLARPTATTVVAFSAICTHQGCTVEPAGRQLGCPCHDSTYDAFTGQVLSGPAPSALHPFAVKIVGTNVVAA